MLRAFIAIQLSVALKSQIAQLQARLKQDAGEIKGLAWVKPEAMHLTLKFLGDIEEADVPKLQSMLETAALAVPAFRLEASGLGAFPNTRAARVIWVGLEGTHDATEALKRLHGGIEQGAAALGFSAEDRTFTAHLTLARLKDRRAAAGCEKILAREEMLQVGAFEARSVALIRSDLDPRGSIYTTLVEVPLRDAL